VSIDDWFMILVANAFLLVVGVKLYQMFIGIQVIDGWSVITVLILFISANITIYNCNKRRDCDG